MNINLKDIIHKWLLFFKYGELNLFRGIQIEVTSHCNRHCYYCPQSVNHLDVKFIDNKIYFKALERIAEFGWVGNLDFSFYNEPMMDNQLEYKVFEALKIVPKVRAQLHSNGDFLTEERLESLLQAGIRRIFVTRHPPYRAAWDKRVYRLAAKYPRYIKVDCIEDKPLETRGNLVKPKVVNDITKGCDQAAVVLTIDIKGDYIFCCCDYDKTEVMGNIFTHSIREMWNNKKYVSARKSVRGGIPVLDVCRACFKGAQKGEKNEL